MALPPVGPNSGGLPPRPTLPSRPTPNPQGVRPPTGLPRPDAPASPQLPQTPEKAANAALRDALIQQNQRPAVSDVTQNNRLGQYDFEAQKVRRTEFTEPSLDDLLAQTEEVPDEVSEDDTRRLEEARIRRERETAERFERSMEEKKRGKVKNNVLKPQEGELDRKGQNVYIDKKNKKLEPFGGKKSAMKQSDVDKRKNLRQGARAVQIIVILLVVVTLGFSVKNAFFPPASLTPQEVQGIVYNTTGTTPFPLERGKMFAEAFMGAYLDYDPSGTQSTAVLQYFTIGKLTPSGLSLSGLASNSAYHQNMIYGPLTYKSEPTSAQSALYTIGALVEITDSTGGNPAAANEPVPQKTEPPVSDESDGDSISEDDSEVDATDSAPGGSGDDLTSTQEDKAALESEANEVTAAVTSTYTGNGKLMWQFFAVNVYYDDENDAFAIVSWPTLVPTPNVIKPSEAPKDSPPGTGEIVDASVSNALQPTIYGFMEAYRVSSTGNYSKLLPYLPDNPGVDLLDGMNSEYEFKSGAADNRSINYTVYETVNPGEWRVQLTVTWTQIVGNAKADFSSTYLMTVVEVGSGYDVTRFIPTFYTP